jgi:O-succinylbenzoate synthase
VSALSPPPVPDLGFVPSGSGDELGDVHEVRLHRVRIPLREPFVAAHGTEVDREVVLVEAVGADGGSGWGECSALRRPTYTAEYTEGAWAALRADLVPAALAGRPVDRERAPMAWCGLSTAVADLRLRGQGRSLAAALGATRTEVSATAVVGQRPSIDDLVAAVGERRTEGYASVKVKIAPGADVGPLAALRAAFPDLGLAADANGSYRWADPAHRSTLAALDDLGLLYVEQPLAPGADADLAAAARALAVPVALDESVGGAADVRRLAAAGGPFALNAKPARVGGLDAVVACLAAAAEAGWPAFVGGMLETGVGRAAALAVAATPSCAWPTDLGPSARYVVDDVTAPVELAGPGRLAVPAGPGVGRAPRADRLAAVTVDRVVIRR